MNKTEYEKSLAERKEIRDQYLLKRVKVEGWPGRIVDVTVSDRGNVYFSLSMDAMEAQFKFGYDWIRAEKVEVME